MKDFLRGLDKRWVIAGCVALAVIVAAIVFITLQKPASELVGTDSKPSKGATPSSAPTPTPVPRVARRLDGALVEPGRENLRPLAVMIENHPDARPQYGLSAANLVYEAIAEGGITRFMAVYADGAGTDVRVEPVRSARTYYLDFATELNALYAHVGGNIDALDQIQNKGGVGNLDQFSVGTPTYARDTARNVATEHTMYSTTGKLWQYADSKGMLSQTPMYPAWKFTDALDAAARPASGSGATINFSTATYKVDWAYDSASNQYLRSMAGTPHLDAAGNAQIKADNVVMQKVAYQHILTRINEQGQKFTLTGSGSGTLLQNGTATPITWKNDGVRTRYYAADGTEISLVRGTTWVELVHPDTAITLK